MSKLETGWPSYIALDERGRPIVEGTTIKVKQLVLNVRGSEGKPEQVA